MKFRSKTVYVDAVQLKDSTLVECLRLAGEGAEASNQETHGLGMKIPAGRGFVLAADGDWIVREAGGKVYPLSAENFEKQFEPMT
jgi:hypothetical protein